MLKFYRSKPRIGQNVLFVESYGCMATDQRLVGVGVIVGSGPLKQNPRFTQWDVELDDNRGLAHFIQGAAGVVRLNTRTWIVYR